MKQKGEGINILLAIVAILSLLNCTRWDEICLASDSFWYKIKEWKNAPQRIYTENMIYMMEIGYIYIYTLYVSMIKIRTLNHW